MSKKFLSVLFAACLFAAGGKCEDLHVQAISKATESILVITDYILDDDLIGALKKFGRQKVRLIITYPPHAAELARVGFQVRAPKKHINLKKSMMIIDGRQIIIIDDSWIFKTNEDPNTVAWAVYNWEQEWATIKNKPYPSPPSTHTQEVKPRPPSAKDLGWDEIIRNARDTVYVLVSGKPDSVIVDTLKRVGNIVKVVANRKEDVKDLINAGVRVWVSGDMGISSGLTITVDDTYTLTGTFADSRPPLKVVEDKSRAWHTTNDIKWHMNRSQKQ
jgi:phosphatidylserine/phosphatidylglycerophosphate/cardiolipin synthase-like enzyme